MSKNVYRPRAVVDPEEYRLMLEFWASVGNVYEAEHAVGKAEHGKPGVVGSWGDYQWLSGVDHDISALLRLCPEVVVGKRLAVTSNDSCALKLTESDKEMGWWTAAERKVFQFNFKNGRDPSEDREIAYSPVLRSIHGLPNETHSQCREGYEEWYVFDGELPDSDIECFVNWMGFRFYDAAVRSVLATNDASSPGIVYCGRQRLHFHESERRSVRIRDRSVLRGPQ